MRRTWAAVLATAVTAFAAPRAVRAQQPQPPAPATTSPAEPAPGNAVPLAASAVGTTIAELAATLSGPDTTATSRQEAARRLVDRQTPDARAALRASLGVAPARLATLHALADDANPDPGLIPLLSAALHDPDERIAAAAAQALGAYKNNRLALDALTAAAADARRRPILRVAAIRGLGLLVEPSAAAALVRIVTGGTEPAEVIAAAGDALVDMTGLEANGRDPARWQQWFDANGNRPPVEWKAAVLESRAARDQRLRRRADALVDETRAFLRQQFLATPADAKSDRLLSYLRADSPEIRKLGASMYRQILLREIAGPAMPAVERRLVDMISDADVDVQLEVLGTLQEVGLDAAQANATLMPQFRIEPDPRVKSALASLMVKKVPAMAEGLLADRDPILVREAAERIRRAKEIVTQQGEEHVKEVADRLRATMTRLAADPSPAALEARRSAGEALAVLKDAASEDFARNLLGASNPPEMRGVGLVILGELGPGPRTSTIIDAIRRERDPEVRIRGMEALYRTRSFEQAGWLFQQFNPNGGDPNPKVREAARDNYRKLLPEATQARLADDANRLAKFDVPLRIDVLKVLVEKLERTGQGKEAAAQRVNIGEDYLQLKKPREAANYLREALAYWRGVNAGFEVTGAMSRLLFRALIESGQYTELKELAEDLVRNSPEADARRYSQEVGPLVRNTAEEAMRTNDPAKWAAAAAMLDAVLKMDPPLHAPYPEDLRRIAAELEEKRRVAGAGGSRPSPR